MLEIIIGIITLVMLITMFCLDVLFGSLIWDQDSWFGKILMTLLVTLALCLEGVFILNVLELL